MKYLQSSVTHKGIKDFLPTSLCETNGAFITNTWIYTIYAWLLLFHVCIQESYDLSFKPSPAFVLWCLVYLGQFSTFRVLMYSAEIWVKPSRIAIYNFVLVRSIIVLCMFVLLYEMQNSVYFLTRDLASARVKECFEWASAANSEEDPKLQVFKPFMWRDQWGFLSWLNWWRLPYWGTLK